MPDPAKKKTEPKTDAEPRKAPTLPTQPKGYRRLRLYSPIWRAKTGDSIHGSIIGTQPVETPDRREVQALLLQLVAPAPVLLFDEAWQDRETVMQPVARVTIEDHAVAAVRVDDPSLARLLLYAEQTPEVQTVEIHACENEDGTRRWLVFIAEKPAMRADVDPVEMRRLQLERAEAAKG